MKLALIVLSVIGTFIHLQADIIVPRYTLLSRLGYGNDQMGLGPMNMGPISMGPMSMDQMQQVAYGPFNRLALPVGPFVYKKIALMGFNPLSVGVQVQSQMVSPQVVQSPIVLSQVIPQQSYPNQQILSHIFQPQLQQQVVSHVVRTPFGIPTLIAPSRFATFVGKRAVEECNISEIR